MRIAVLRPQVPFARGGAEIFTDELVERAPRARPRRRPRLGPVQVVSGRARPDAGVPLANARPRGGRRTPDRPRRRDEVPLVRRAPSGRSGSGSCTSSARPTSSTAPSSDSSGRRRRSARCAGRCRSSTARRLARRRASSRPRRTSPAGSSAPRGSSRRCSRTRRRRLPYRSARVRGLRPLGEPPRPGQADRPAARGAALDAGSTP